MNFNVRHLQRLKGLRQIDGSDHESALETIQVFLGDEARIAYQSFTNKKKLIINPSPIFYGLTHSQLRGVRRGEREMRSNAYAQAVANNKLHLESLDRRYSNLLSDIAIVNQAIAKYCEHMEGANASLLHNVAGLSGCYAIGQNTKPFSGGRVVMEVPKYNLFGEIVEWSCSLIDIVALLEEMGFDSEQLSLVNLDKSELDVAPFIYISGKHFNLKIAQNGNYDAHYIHCSIEGYYRYRQGGITIPRIIGGWQDITFYQNYGLSVGNWVCKNRYVLDLTLDSDLIYMDEKNNASLADLVLA